jgi:hypothetical protein
MRRGRVNMRQSAKATSIQETGNSMLQNHYYEAHLIQADKLKEEATFIQGMGPMPIKYIPRKMSR